MSNYYLIARKFDTNSFKIHYSKTGTHIVPYRKGGKQNEG